MERDVIEIDAVKLRKIIKKKGLTASKVSRGMGFCDGALSSALRRR